MTTTFNDLLFSQTFDTFIRSTANEVEDLTDYLYSLMIGKELSRNSSKAKKTLKIVTLNLFDAVSISSEMYVRYSRNENLYHSSNRYVSTMISYNALVDKVLPALIRLGLITNHIGFKDRNTGKGFISRMKATKAFIELADQFSLTPDHLQLDLQREVIVLKDTEKQRIQYKETPFTKKVRAELNFINHHLLAHTVDLAICPSQMNDLQHNVRVPSYRRDERAFSMFTNKTLYRVFSNNSWEQNGRFYGAFWQNIPKEYRQNLTIDGMATVEFDYSSLHPKMLYDRIGVEMVRDPYEGVGNLDRKAGKRLVNIILNATDKSKAVEAVMSEFRPLYKDEALSYIRSAENRHPSLKQFFYTGVGLDLMFLDSRIASNVMLRAIDEYQTILLPIHDSFVCLDSFQEQLRSLMEEEYESVVGTDNTIAVEQKASSVAMTVEEKMMQDELGEGYTPFVEHPDEQRYAALQRQARHYQTEYGIVYEDVFTAQELEAKYIDLLRY